jgi:hypothetical protein
LVILVWIAPLTWTALDFGLLAQTIMLAREDMVDSIVAQAFVAYPDICVRIEFPIPEDCHGIGLGYQNPQSIINTYRSPRRSLQETVTFNGT